MPAADTIALWPLLLLCLGTFLISLFVAAVGPTGGLQLALVAALLPPQLAIPVHAWITGTSAAFRGWHLRTAIDWNYVIRFAPWSLAASVAAVTLALQIDGRRLQLIIGIFILGGALQRSTNVPAAAGRLLAAPLPCGLITGFLTVFVGATGPLLFALLMQRLHDRLALAGTHGACMTLQHLAKIGLFGLAGVSLLRYPLLLASTLLAAWLGSRLGATLLLRIPARIYERLIFALMLCSGLFIIAGALSSR